MLKKRVSTIKVESQHRFQWRSVFGKMSAIQSVDAPSREQLHICVSNVVAPKATNLLTGFVFGIFVICLAIIDLLFFFLFPFSL